MEWGCLWLISNIKRWESVPLVGSCVDQVKLFKKKSKSSWASGRSQLVSKEENSMVDESKFQDWTFEETLYFFEGPKIFTLKHDGQLFLAFFCETIDHETEKERHILVPLSNDQLDLLKNDELDFNSVLSTDSSFLVEIHWKLIIEPSFVQEKEHYIPRPGVTLHLPKEFH